MKLGSYRSKSLAQSATGHRSWLISWLICTPN